MAKKINLDFVDSIGENKSAFSKQSTSSVEGVVLKLGILYAKHMADELNKANAVSSGRGADSLNPSEVIINKNTTSVNINGNFYLKFVDKGVNGWANSRGSIYSFRTKGVAKDGAMVKSIKEYLTHQKGLGADKYKINRPINAKEEARKKLQNIDITTRRAMTVAYMIKRMGIKPTHFIQKATEKVKKDIAKELGEAFANDIISQLN